MSWARLFVPLGSILLFWAACTGRPPADGPSSTSPVGNQPESPAESVAQVEEPVESVAKDALGHQIERVTIYYRHPKFEAIVPLRKNILRHVNMADQIKQVIDYLTIPPQNGKGLPIWPTNTYVREVYLIRDATVVVDLDGRFLTELSVGCTREEFMVYSLVNSILVNFAPYDKVRVLVDGEPRETLLGHIDIELSLYLQDTLYTVLPEKNEEQDIIEENLDGPSEEDLTNPMEKDKKLGF